MITHDSELPAEELMAWQNSKTINGVDTALDRAMVLPTYQKEYATGIFEDAYIDADGAHFVDHKGDNVSMTWGDTRPMTPDKYHASVVFDMHGQPVVFWTMQHRC